MVLRALRGLRDVLERALDVSGSGTLVRLGHELWGWARERGYIGGLRDGDGSSSDDELATSWLREEVDEILETMEEEITAAHRNAFLSSDDSIVLVMRCKSGEFHLEGRDREEFVQRLDPSSRVRGELPPIERPRLESIPYWCVLVDQETTAICVMRMERMIMTGRGSSAIN